MISETFTDTYGTTVTVRKLRDEDTHVQLLMSYADGSEQTSYGFTIEDFGTFASAVSDLADRLS